MSLVKHLWDRYRSHPLRKTLKKYEGLAHVRILILWNRGLGDIPLGLYALVVSIRRWAPQAEITFLTRPDLEMGFFLLEGVRVLVDPTWKRSQPIDLAASLERLEIKESSFDLILEKPNPARTELWQIGKLTPKLRWDPSWDEKALILEKLDEKYIGIHLHSETVYGYEKNWPLAYWKELFASLTHRKLLIFGSGKGFPLEMDHLIDLRGKTDLITMLSLIKNRCDTLIAPDSGILSMVYYIDSPFPLKVISLWADPCQGVLKQNVASPNPFLEHLPLRSEMEDLQRLLPQTVLDALSPSRPSLL